YQNRNPEVATLVLNELVTRYFAKHLQVHRSAGAFDFVSQQADQIRARLNQTEDALNKLKSQAGVISLQDSMSTFSTQSSHMDDLLRSAQSDLAEQEAKVKQIEQGGAGLSLNEGDKSNDSNASPPPNQSATNKEIGDDHALLTNLESLRKTQLEMTGKYTDNNPLVQMNQTHITELEKQKQDLEKKFPELATLAHKGASGSLDLRVERARLAGMRSKLDDLRRQKKDLEERVKQLGDVGPQIASLDRQKE